MRLYAPKYYNEFKCIADACTHSCCVGWRVELDEETREKYERAEGGYAERMRERIEVDGDGAYIPALPSGRCPHLDDCGLCRIITEYGEGYLSDICREHPRFYNYVADRAEVGIGASCPEAARLILEGDCAIVPIGEACDTECADEYNALALRDDIYRKADAADSYTELKRQLLEMPGIPESLTSGELRSGIFSELEYLYEENRDLLIRSAELITRLNDKRLIKVLLYFVYRHLTEADSESDARTRLGFALFSTEAVAALALLTNDLAEALRIYSEEIEYSPDNTEAVLFEIESEMI